MKFGTEAAAKMAGCTQRTINFAIVSGKLPATVRPGGGEQCARWRYEIDEGALIAWMASRPCNFRQEETDD